MTTTQFSLLVLCLATFAPTAYGHYPWTTIVTDNEATHVQHVEVVLSDHAGVRNNATASLMDHGVTTLTHTASCGSYQLALTPNAEADALIGVMDEESCTCSAFVSGKLDWGPYKDIYADTLNTFTAQSYQKPNDYKDFFLPALDQVHQPTIFLRNCMTMATPKDDDKDDNDLGGGQLDFAIGGFPSEPASATQERSNLWLCLYWKGGIEIGCQEYRPSFDAHGKNVRAAFALPATTLVQEGGSVPVGLYALGEMKVTDKVTGKVNVTFATTSVSFEGFCTE